MTPTPNAPLPPHTIEAAMSRAIDLAQRGPAYNKNPQVGCVILNEHGTTVAEGWHEGAGTPHAEVMALDNLPLEYVATDGSSGPNPAAAGLTAVVTLEPCNHVGLAQPCTLALTRAGIGAVRYAVSDPGHESGGGADRLKEAGIDAEGGILEDTVRVFMRSWLSFQATGLPYVILKWASSLDGRAAAADGTSRWITGPEARAHVHRQRSHADAIVVGTGTALADNPSLTARRPDGSLYDKQPVPVVVGTRAIPAAAAIWEHPQTPLFYDGHDLRAMLADLASHNIRSLYIEGGPKLASSFLKQGLVDEVHAYIAPVILGGSRTAITDVGISTITDAQPLRPLSITTLGEDTLITVVSKTAI
ncbi:bifunctional diaminohydroxyphosphoribosylaminopyrimidine deaminase/5-amino-6-(5-phosphoribosylamino)uracil reductase RibD [Lysinibacter sp. HNR]|uniref:bifunctional diaminohydroxyphosphoribosylaminopyrimidine deaminase/5-amino-6-(5-phosphoribosylamino)uracil reductase RibD n=1 Tax=Lysinibacter sp. HNR TaxID=3031408 RepID=UPI002435CCCD|nr:bifunctional diaminohydroxyphosphoribosylaminopyrimidine deaminase/5-amino-6-(5-phosphoribosylamino)uracil reductase RibD [Lysinibacter sp. HNR]WGD37050.1 bifunctional diaminohydroxyphosphoribosylaminopyrimidine deaminase/5-amino-6-(5-phosphoribosylamino)uracil reductase RibD [Lysinibacter sp. HNR]